MKKGFTLLELIVSLAIFTFMTAFLLAKYGTFNQSVILTDLAYDTAITVRNAQASALNTQGVSSSTALGNLVFNNVYGVHFVAPANSFIYFVNPSAVGSSQSPSQTYVNNQSQIIGTYTMKAGDSVSTICINSPCPSGTSEHFLDVSFQRPNPDATITSVSIAGATTTSSYADITIMGSDGSTRDIVIQGTGEISVTN